MKENVKYPRTFHLPYSLGYTSDDKVLSNTDMFKNVPVVVTEKMDGENCTMTRSSLYARSVSSDGGLLRERVKSLWGGINYLIPDGWRICGENMQWEHSIRYEDLVSPFYAFSVWNENNVCLDWRRTVNFLESLSIPTVRVLYKGVYNEDLIKALDVSNIEGYVVRRAEAFHYSDFKNYVGKYVRKNHVQTDIHWSENLKENGFLKL